MKKQLFLMAIMAGAICLTSCEQKPGPDVPPGPDDSTKTDVKVTVNPHEVVLTAEEPSVRLAATLDPADPTATITWSSSDTTVAVVTSRGYVEATGYGECYIYASVGKAKDSCHVQVKTYLESILFNCAFLYDVDSTYAYSETEGKYIVDTIESSGGDTYYAYRSLATLWLFSDGFYINESGQLDGTEQGVIIEYQAPMWYATAYLNHTSRGTVFSLGDWAIREDAENYAAHVSAPGSIDKDEFIAQMKGFIAAYNAGDESYPNYLEAASKAVKMPYLGIRTYRTISGQSGYFSSYIPDAIVDESVFTVTNDPYPASSWMYSLSYSNITFRPLDGLWGLNVDEDEAGKLTLLDEEIYYADPINSIYGEYSSNAMQMMPTMAPLASENAEIKANLMRQLKDKNIRVIRMK